jgi:hypothetical protein
MDKFGNGIAMIEHHVINIDLHTKKMVSCLGLDFSPRIDCSDCLPRQVLINIIDVER